MIKRLITNKWFIFSLIVIIIAVTVFCVWFFAFKDDTIKIRKVDSQHDITQRKISDYNGSYLELNKNGTFVIVVKYLGENEFMGIGTYTKGKNSYHLKYMDLYRMRDSGEGAVMERDEDFQFWEYTAYVSKGLIGIYDPVGRYYYFK